jgi:exodeoxyribonuclease VII small subunit
MNRRLDEGSDGTATPGRNPGDLSFEQAQRELEQIVERLERGDAGVDELTKLWERGEELYRTCAAKLEAVHGRIEELARAGEGTSS